VCVSLESLLRFGSVRVFFVRRRGISPSLSLARERVAIQTFVPSSSTVPPRVFLRLHGCSFSSCFHLCFITDEERKLNLGILNTRFTPPESGIGGMWWIETWRPPMAQSYLSPICDQPPHLNVFLTHYPLTSPG